MTIALTVFTLDDEAWFNLLHNGTNNKAFFICDAESIQTYIYLAEATCRINSEALLMLKIDFIYTENSKWIYELLRFTISNAIIAVSMFLLFS